MRPVPLIRIIIGIIRVIIIRRKRIIILRDENAACTVVRIIEVFHRHGFSKLVFAVERINLSG